MRNARYWFPLFLLSALLLFQNCGSSGGSDGGSGGDRNDEASARFPYSNPGQYFQRTQKTVIEVYYEPGAEPFTGTTPKGRPYWGILEDNLGAVFQFRAAPPTLAVPKTLAEMSPLPAQGRSEWRSEDILALHGGHKQADPTATEARFYVYFLRGHFSSGNGPEKTVIGVSLGGTPVIAMFKEVIQNSGLNPSGPVAKFVEQSTLVHEMGHALGFVNNGVPMAAPHHDAEHGAHTTNRDCVMYWLNEGAGDLAQFVQRYLASASVVMWGPEVLADAKAFSR